MTPTSTLDRRGAWLMAGSLGLLLAIVGVAGWRAAHDPVIEPETLHVRGQREVGEVSIVLDATDPLTAQQQAAVAVWWRELEFPRLRPHEHVSLWVLGDRTDGGLQRQFARYYPGVESDPILHNPAQSRAACDSLFTRPLLEALSASESGESSRHSLLLEAVREVSTQPEFASPKLSRRIVLISDLRENAPALSFYGGVPQFESFRVSRTYAQLRPELRGVEVELVYVPRGPWDVCPSRLREFWLAYFSASGASPVSVRRL